MINKIIKKLVEPIVQEELDKRNSKCTAELNTLRDLTHDNRKHLDSLEFLLKMYQGKLRKECDERKKLLDEYQKTIALQKLHCYIIPRLIDSSGLEISDGFDINKYEDALQLYNRLRNGDLKDY